ncbi:MAG: BON domain-containing protein [Steroidobacteraceae bacterium]
MSSSLQPRRLVGALGVAAAVTLTGCASYRRCGYAGCPGDAEITAQFNALLRQHPALEAPNTVRAHTVDRVVYLYGQVDTELERSEAEELAHQVAGVTRVVDSINFSFEGR